MILTSDAQALTWHLRHVQFENGSIATGFFDFDATTSIYSNVHIHTSSAIYKISLPFPISKPSQLTAQNFARTWELSLVLAHPLPSIGGILSILPPGHDSREVPRTEPLRDSE